MTPKIPAGPNKPWRFAAAAARALDLRHPGVRCRNGSLHKK